MSFVKQLIKFIFSLLLSPLKIIPFKKDKIIIQGTNPHNYSNNPRYLFEFLSKKKLNVYWFCQNDKIKEYLKKRGYKFISFSNPIKLILITLKAKVIVDGGSNYYNLLNLIPKSCKKIHISHGAANKMVIHNFIGSKKKNLYFQKFDYVNFPSKYIIKKVAKNQFNLPDDKIVKLGFPKFEELKVKYKNNNKKKKLIFYTPTWRPYEYSLPILNIKKFNLEDFKIFLKSNNLVFVYSRHSNNYEYKKDNIEDNKNIFFINTYENPLFDVTKYLKKVDLLINDCSSTSIESLFLGLPQINVFPDLKKYKKESGFLNDYKENLTGPLINDYETLKKFILLYLKKKNVYRKQFERNNLIEKKRYYDMFHENSNDLSIKFIKSLL